jgi:hypothetical protein
MLHIALSLRHRVFRNALMARASKQMAAKFWDFEARSIAVFQEGEENWLGPQQPAMQPFLYCLAQPATLAWASKYGFATMQNLSQCPSYIRALESFNVPALAGSAPSLTHLTKKTTTVGHRSPGDQGSAVSGSESFRAQREAMMQLLGVENSSPSKSTLRKLSQKQSRRSHVGRALDHGEMEDDPDDVSKLPPLAEVIDVDKAKASPQREPVSHHRRPTPRSTHPCSSPRSAHFYLSGVSLWRPRSLLENWTASFPHRHLCLKPPTTRRPKSPSALTASVLCRSRSVRLSLCSRTSGPSGPPKACACTQRILPPRIVHSIRHGSHYRTGQHSLECQRSHPGSNKCRPGVQISVDSSPAGTTRGPGPGFVHSSHLAAAHDGRLERERKR